MTSSPVTLHYLVAGFRMDVTLPACLGEAALPCAFAPFRSAAGDGDGLLEAIVSVNADMEAHCEWQGGRAIEQSISDMGRLTLFATDGGYRVELRGDGGTHVMAATPDFSRVHVSLDADGSDVASALSSMLRIAFAQAILPRGAVSLHASAISCDGRAYLFMGVSGTGKSTHSRLWLSHIPGSDLLNDDNPTVRLVDGKPVASGTPWSGKTPCYKAQSYPVAAMARLVQAPVNEFTRCDGAAAFAAIYPGCSVIAQDARLRAHLYDTIAAIADTTIVGVMRCRPDRDAAVTCATAMGIEP